jgi:hypothetical protein
MAAQQGDAQSLAVLLMRHRAAMHAVAAAVLGAGPDLRTWCRMPRWSRSPMLAGSGTRRSRGRG